MASPRRLRAAATVLLFALMLPPVIPSGAAATMPMQDLGGGSQVPPYEVNFAVPARPGPAVSALPTVFIVQCQGPCGAKNGGPQLDFQFRTAADPQHVDRSVSSTSYTTFTHEGSSVPWYNYSFSVRLPRSLDPQFRVHLSEANGEFASAWQALPGVRGGVATFADAGTTTAYRGDAPHLKSLAPAYLANPASFSPDPDTWDNQTIPDGAPQTFRWDLGPAGQAAFPVTHPADVAAIQLAPRLTRLTRDGCLAYTVTVDDSAGQAAEGSAYRAGVLDAYFDPTAAPASLQTGPATYTVEHVCVQNDVPRFTANFLPDPGNTTNGAFVFGSVLDQDYSRGYDKLVFTVWDHQSPTASGARQLGTWDWDAIKAEGMIPVPLASLVDGSALCVLDYERNGTVAGQLVHDVANLLSPVCSSFAKTPQPGLSKAAITRLIVEAGPQERTWAVTNGALHETHHALPFDPAHPRAVLPALDAILQGLLNEGVGPDTTTLAAFTIPNLPANDTTNALVAQVTAHGVLVIVPAGLPSALADVTPKWEIQGLAAHPDALTVGAASQDGTHARPDSANGPSALLRQKPDVTVRVPDALTDGTAAQGNAVLYAADLALWYELRGVTAPRLVKGLILQQALPVHGGGSLGTASSTGAGALDPTLFSSDPSLNRTTLPTANLDATLRAVAAAAVVPLPVITPNVLLDIGVVNQNIEKDGSIALENPNGLLKQTLDTHTGSLAAALPAGVDPYAPSRTVPTVTVNVTFYSLLDITAHNLTDAMLGSELHDRLADLAASHVAAGAPDPFALTGAERNAILSSLRVGDPPRGWSFIPEQTVPVPDSTYATSCRAPSLAPLNYHAQAAAGYLLLKHDFGTRNAVLAAMGGIQAAKWDDCALAMSVVHARLNDMLRALDARAATVGPEPYLTQARAGIVSDGADIDLVESKSIGQATLFGLTWLPLATDPARTAQAPAGPYVGVVRITTHNQCTMDLAGNDTACRDGTDYALASLTLVGDTSFVLRDRAGRAMPGRLVTLQRLVTPFNCAGAAGGGASPMLSTLALGNLFSGVDTFAAATDATGIVRFPWVPAGFYDLHDGFSGFPIHGTWDGGNGTENDGFREADCHLPVPVHGDLDATLGTVLGAAAELPCVKSATGGLPVVSVLQALDAQAAAAPLPGCSPGALGSAAAQSASNTLRAALQALFGPESWQIVYPQVQQGRLVDAVQGSDVTAEALGDASSPTAWTFSTSGSRVAADGNLLTAQAAAFEYSYNLPPNEELAMKWKFTLNMSNTAGLAIFTIRDDLHDILQTLASRNPASAAVAAADLADLLAGSANGGTSQCAPLAHYRIIPLVPLGGIANTSAAPRSASDATDVEVSALGTHATVSRYFRFHTRECPRGTAHAAFLFFPLAPGAGSLVAPGVHFSVEDQNIWTWAGLGTGAIGCPGAWCLLKLSDAAAMQQPFAMSTLDQSDVAVDTSAFAPKIEGWDSFVDMMDDARVLTTPAMPAAEIPNLLLHPNIEDAAGMGSAPDLPGTVLEWLTEAQQSAYLSTSGVALGPQQAQYLAQGDLLTPDRNSVGGPLVGDYVKVDWQQAPGAAPTFGAPSGAKDASPSHATSTSMAAMPVTGGRFGGGYQFAGAGNAIAVPQSGVLMDSGTVMMWVKPTSRNWEANRLFFHQHPGVVNQLAVRLDTAGHVYFQTGSNDPATTMVSTDALPLNQWSHIAMTWAPDGMRVYVNGHASGSLPTSDGVQADYTSTMIGNSPNDVGTGGFQGTLDEVREYDVALDATTITSLKDNPYATPSGQPSADPSDAPRLIGHERFSYPMDGAVHAGDGGHVSQEPVLGIGNGFNAGADPTRTLAFDDLLGPLPIPLTLVNLASPSWVNHPSYQASAQAITYTKMLHAPRAQVAARAGAWIFQETHPRTGTPPAMALPPETPFPTPLLPWVPGTNTERFNLDVHATVAPTRSPPVQVSVRGLPCPSQPPTLTCA